MATILTDITEGNPVKGSQAFEAEYKGATFRFASEKNRQQSLDNPEKYVPAYLSGFNAQLPYRSIEFSRRGRESPLLGISPSVLFGALLP